MADPVTMAAVGAGAGAMLDKKDPLRGAMLGGVGGYFAPSLPGLAGAAGGEAAAAGGLASEGLTLGPMALANAPNATFGAGSLGLQASPSLLSSGLANAPALPGLSSGAAQMAALGAEGSGLAAAGSALAPDFAMSRFMGSMTDKMASNPMGMANLGMQGMKMMGGQKEQMQQQAPQMAAPSLRPIEPGQGPSFAQLSPAPQGFMTPLSTKKRMQGLLGG